MSVSMLQLSIYRIQLLLLLAFILLVDGKSTRRNSYQSIGKNRPHRLHPQQQQQQGVNNYPYQHPQFNPPTYPHPENNGNHNILPTEPAVGDQNRPSPPVETESISHNSENTIPSVDSVTTGIGM